MSSPMSRYQRQRLSRPERHSRQRPHEWPGLTTTSSPTATPLTPGPTSSTVPATSAPRQERILELQVRQPACAPRGRGGSSPPRRRARAPRRGRRAASGSSSTREHLGAAVLTQRRPLSWRRTLLVCRRCRTAAPENSKRSHDAFGRGAAAGAAGGAAVGRGCSSSSDGRSRGRRSGSRARSRPAWRRRRRRRPCRRAPAASGRRRGGRRRRAARASSLRPPVQTFCATGSQPSSLAQACSVWTPPSVVRCVDVGVVSTQPWPRAVAARDSRACGSAARRRGSRGR